MKQTSVNLLLMAILGLTSVVAAIGLRAWLYPERRWQAVTLLPEPNANLQGYHITIGDKAPIYFDQGRGKWFLFYFGYSTCTPSCQQTLENLDTIARELDGTDAQYAPSVTLISLDPAIDNGQVFSTFIDKHYPNLNGISAHEDELEKLASFFGLPFHHTTPEADKAWLDQHPSRIYIIDPQLRYIGSFAPDAPAEAMYADMQQLTHQLWRYHHNR